MLINCIYLLKGPANERKKNQSMPTREELRGTVRGAGLRIRMLASQS